MIYATADTLTIRMKSIRVLTIYADHDAYLGICLNMGALHEPNERLTERFCHAAF